MLTLFMKYAQEGIAYRGSNVFKVMIAFILKYRIRLRIELNEEALSNDLI